MLPMLDGRTLGYKRGSGWQWVLPRQPLGREAMQSLILSARWMTPAELRARDAQVWQSGIKSLGQYQVFKPAVRLV